MSSEDEGPVAWLRRTIGFELGDARRVVGLRTGLDDPLPPAAAARWEETTSGVLDIGATDESDAWHGVWAMGDSRVTRFIAANDPESRIADLEAKLAILDEHYILASDDRNEAYEEFSVVAIGGADKDSGCATCHYYGQGGVKGYGICLTVRLLASGYRHRPGYEEAGWTSEQPPGSSPTAAD